MDIDYFSLLKEELPSIKTLSKGIGVNAFYAQEVLRFHSIAGTILESFNLDDTTSIEQRYLNHILCRSLLENYFWILYLYDDQNKKNSRYESLIKSFKKEYFKLMNDPRIGKNNSFEPSEPEWKNIPKGLDIKSILDQIKNDYGDRLSYIYFVYRISSFDTHGKNLNAIFQSTFVKQVNFPILKLKYTFNLIANQYILVLRELEKSAEI